MTVSNPLLFAAVVLFVLAAMLDLLVCVNAVDLRRPINALLTAAGLACFAAAFLVG